MTDHVFKITPSIYDMFGGKSIMKKAKQQKKSKAKKHTDYSKIKLNKIDKDVQKPIEPIEVKNDVIRIVHEEESLNSTIENPSNNTYYKYRNRIELQCTDNQSRDSECDMNEEEEQNEFIINDNDNDNGYSTTPRVSISYSQSTNVFS
eukprot:217649_1